MVVPETGVALNNFMRWFDREPTSPNVIGPAKKNEMCVSPAQIWDADGLRLLIGTPGSYGILQTTPQMIMNILDHQMNVQAAIEGPPRQDREALALSSMLKTALTARSSPSWSAAAISSISSVIGRPGSVVARAS